MEANLHTYFSSEQEQEEDYINMEVDSPLDGSIFRRHSSTKEFEFQSSFSATSSDRDHHPADDLFFMGKLLPLHLPHRLQILLQNTTPKSQPSDHHHHFDESIFSTPIFTPTANTTPFQSCNISPSDSCHVSGELNPAVYFVAGEHLSPFAAKKSKSPPLTWTKRLKLLKLAANFKSLFTKSSGCSAEYSAAAAKQRCTDGRPMTTGNNAAAFGHIKYYDRMSSIGNKEDENVGKQCRKPRGGHRRSFSGAFKMMSKPKTLLIDSSASLRSESLINRHVFRRSTSSSTEFENPIQAAIAHCKKSQIANHEVACCSKSATSCRVIYDDHVRPGLCRG